MKDEFEKPLKDFVEKNTDFDIETNLSRFHPRWMIFGKKENVKLFREFMEISPNTDARDIAMGLLFGYPEDKVASFVNRMYAIDGLESTHMNDKKRAIRSRNPIQDVLSGKRDCVLISIKKFGRHDDAQAADKLINQLKKIIKKEKDLDFWVRYQSNRYGNAYIVFGRNCP